MSGTPIVLREDALRYQGEETEVALWPPPRGDHGHTLTTVLLCDGARRATPTVRVRKHEARKDANLRARGEDQVQRAGAMVGSVPVVALREARDPSTRGGFRYRGRAARGQIVHARREIRDGYVEIHAYEASLRNGPLPGLDWVAPSFEIRVEQSRRHSGSTLERHPRGPLGHGEGTLHVAAIDPETGWPVVTFDPEKNRPA
jgi:hypothetical protein